MELDPKYADVIVRRWQAFSGDAAVLDNDGWRFEEMAAGREAPAAAQDPGCGDRSARDPVDGAAPLRPGLVRTDLAGAGRFDGEPKLLLQRAPLMAPRIV
jgi:hypothetical protein